MNSEFRKHLHDLGFDEAFYAGELAKATDLHVARVTCVHKGRFTLSNGAREISGEMSGKMLANAESPFEYPVVGDWVLVSLYNDGAFAVIHSLLQRKSLLRRKMSGRDVEFQLIAANIDTALVMQALDADFSANRLARYLVMINEDRIQPAVLLSKSDLLTPEEVGGKVAEAREALPDTQILPVSNKTGEGLRAVRDLLAPRRTYCLLGSSGVGKTTLLNAFLGEEAFATTEVREKDGKGRHTTTARHLIKLESGALVIDTPGMRELGNFDIGEGLEETFADIIDLSKHCKFNDCAHQQEKGCAVLAAVKDGSLTEKRYQNYLKMNREAAYHERSYVEKRQRDKKFGKMCREVMKFKKDKW